MNVTLRMIGTSKRYSSKIYLKNMHCKKKGLKVKNINIFNSFNSFSSLFSKYKLVEIRVKPIFEARNDKENVKI